MAILKIKQANGAWLPVEDPTALHVNNPQTLDADQQEKVRQAIGAASSGDLSGGLGTKLDLPEDPRNFDGDEINRIYFGDSSSTVSVLKGIQYSPDDSIISTFVISKSPDEIWQGTGNPTQTNFNETIIVAREGRSGQIKVPETPIADNDATSKKYVDGQVATKTSVTVGGAPQETFDADTKVTNLAVDNNYERLYGQGAGASTRKAYVIANTATATTSGRIVQYTPAHRSATTTCSGILCTGTPVYNYDAANKKYVDDNFINKSGDATLTGSLVVTGDLTIRGTTKTQDAQTQLIEENIIELNSGKIDNSTYLSGLAINKNSESTYGIMYDPVSDAVKLGLGKTENGEFSFNTGEGTPLATRQEFDNSWLDEAIFVFDKATKKFKYSGTTLSGLKAEIKADMAAYIETYMSQTVLTYEDGSAALSVSGETQEIQNENGGTTLVVGTDY